MTSRPEGSKKQQPVSCAECRRLKLKCDRVFPCSSCIRRGCANLCPDGTLEKGKRGFLRRLEQSLPTTADGSEVAMFVARDTAMASRIQELEAALTNAGLAIPGGMLAGKPPLPARPSAPNKRRRSTSPPEDHRSPMDLSGSSTPAEQQSNVALGFGTLTIDAESFRSRYIGLSGASAYLNSDMWGPKQRVEPAPLHWIPNQDSAALPSYEEACRLANLYFTNAAWMYEVVPKEIFFCDHLTPTYFPPTSEPQVAPKHDVMALVFIVFALGAFFDLSLPIPVAKDLASEYYLRSVSWLYIHVPREGVLRVDTIQAIQTLHLTAFYQLSTRRDGDGEEAWQLLGTAMRALMAQGCHRDGSRWHLPQRELEQRRRVFWETHMYDRLQASTFGRPYAINDSHHDCEMPTTCDTPLPSDAPEDRHNFSHTKWHTYKFRFAALLGRVADEAFATKQPTYNTVKQLDKEISDFYETFPPWLSCPSIATPVKEVHSGPGKGNPQDMRKDAQIHSIGNMVFLSILDLHKGPFCRYLMMKNDDSRKALYEASVIRLTGAARAIINNARGLFSLHPELTTRIYYLFFHAFTAAVCQSVLVIVAPFHPLAPLAHESMLNALEMFNAAEGDMAKAASGRISRLAEKAKIVIEEWRQQQTREAVQAVDTPTTPGSPSGSSRSTVDSGRFPESNLREMPDDLLGTSTTLVRLPPRHHHERHTPFPSMEPVLPNYMSSWLPVPSSSAMPVGWSDETFLNYLNTAQVDTSRWPANGYGLYGGEGGVNVDGFDLSGFIEDGASAWDVRYTSGH